MNDRNFAEKKLIEELSAICEGLMWVSESDYPWQITAWQSENNISSEILRDYYRYDPETKVSIETLSSFLKHATIKQEWQDEIERRDTQGYQNLYSWLKKNLKDVQVFLVGEIEIDVYILGKSNNNTVVCLSTKIVET